MRRISPTCRKPSRLLDGPAHEDVAPERQLVGQRPLLVDGLDAERAGLLDGQVATRLAVEEHLARVGPVDAGDDLDQRGLARAVVAEQPDDLAAIEVEVDVVERPGRRRTTCRRAAARGVTLPAAVAAGSSGARLASAGRALRSPAAASPDAGVAVHQRICCVTSGAIASTFDLSTKPPPVLMNRPLKPYFLVRQSCSTASKPCRYCCWSMTRLM